MTPTRRLLLYLKNFSEGLVRLDVETAGFICGSDQISDLVDVINRAVDDGYLERKENAARLDASRDAGKTVQANETRLKGHNYRVLPPDDVI